MKKAAILLTVLTALATYCLAATITYPPEKGTDFVKNMKIRNLYTLESPVFNVKGYGVTGDHSAADYARLVAMESAVYAAGGGVIYFPPGSYSFDGWVGWRSGYQIEMAPGAVFDIRNDTGDWMSFADGPSQLRNVGRFQQIFDINEPNDVVFSKPGEIWVGWWLGKVGDGVTDDGLVLQAMNESAYAGSTIHPYGRHKTTKQLFIYKDGITIDGIDPNTTSIEGYANHTLPDNNEPIIRHPTKFASWTGGPMRCFIMIDSPTDTSLIENITVKNIKIRPPVNNQTDLMQIYGYSLYSEMKTLRVGCVQNFRADNLIIYGQAWEGLYHDMIYNGTNVVDPIRHRITNCTFLPPSDRDPNAEGAMTNYNRSSIDRASTDKSYMDLVISGCTYDNVSMGILMGGSGYVIANNLFRDISNHGIDIGENERGCGTRGVISNNVFTRSGNGFLAYRFMPCSIFLCDAESGCTVIGNTISDTYKGPAITIKGDRFNVVGNTISGQLGGQTAYAFQFNASGNVPYFMTYMSSNVVCDSNTPGFHKFYGGLNWQAQSGAVGSHVYMSNNFLDCNVVALAAGTDPNFATIHLAGDRIRGVIYPGTYDYAWNQTMNDANQWDDIPLFATFGGTNKPILLETGYISGMQQENCYADNNTVIPLTDYLNIVAANAESPGEDPNVTISETGAKDGQHLTITTWPSSDDYVIKRIAGQVETTGNANIAMSWTGLKSVQFIYMYDRWMQVAAGDGTGFTNLTDFDTQTAWRIFYSNADGDTTELALGSDGEYLKSNGATSAPTWATPSGAAHDAVTLTGLATDFLTLSTQAIDVNQAGTLAANPVLSANQLIFGTTGIIFEGSTADAVETLITVTDPTSTDKTITFPNATGTVAVSATSPITLSAAGDIGAGATLISLAGLTETNGGIPYGTADNAYAWLAAGAEGTLLMGNGAGAPSWLAAGATTTILVGGGAADPVWTTATGTGAPVRAGTPTFTTSAISPIWQSGAADAADAGAVRLGNAEVIGWEASPASTDITLTVDSSEIMQASGTFNAVTLTEGANAVPNVTDNLSVFAATTSAQLSGVLSNEMGTGVFVLDTDPTITDANFAGITTATRFGIGAVAPTNVFDVNDVLSTTYTSYWDITTSGSDATQRNGLFVNMDPGYDGNQVTAAITGFNKVAGIAEVLHCSASLGWYPDGMRGLNGYSNGTGNMNIGGLYLVSNAVNCNFGIVSSATNGAANDSNNIGVWGNAHDNSGGGFTIGGYFTLNKSTTMPTFTTAALVADNGDFAGSIFIARDNGTPVFTIGNGGAITATGVTDFGGATSLEIPNATDPDTTVTGQVSFDTDGANESGDVSIRGFDGTNQFLVAKKLKEIYVGPVIKPQDLADATRDKLVFWPNVSGMTFTVVRVLAMSDTDDTDFNVEEYDADGASNNAVVAAIQCTTGSGPYTDDERTITGATIEAGHVLAIDFDDTDDPGWVQITIVGWFDSNVD